MKNDKCLIYITTKGGSTQIYRKNKDGWAQTSSKGIVRKNDCRTIIISSLASSYCRIYREGLA